MCSKYTTFFTSGTIKMNRDSISFKPWSGRRETKKMYFEMQTKSGSEATKMINDWVN